MLRGSLRRLPERCCSGSIGGRWRWARTGVYGWETTPSPLPKRRRRSAADPIFLSCSLPNSSRLKSLGLRGSVIDEEEELHFLVDFDELGADESHSFEEHEEEEDGDSGPGLQNAGLPIPVLVLEVANLLAGPQLEHSASE